MTYIKALLENLFENIHQSLYRRAAKCIGGRYETNLKKKINFNIHITVIKLCHWCYDYRRRIDQHLYKGLSVEINFSTKEIY
jgi:hypothetical protein